MCIACSAGKYLTNAAGGTDAASCTSVSAEACVLKCAFVSVAMQMLTFEGRLGLFHSLTLFVLWVCASSARAGGSRLAERRCVSHAARAST